MDYDATHKASSITSITSTNSSDSSNSAWDLQMLQPDKEDYTTALVDYQYHDKEIRFSPIYLQHGDQITAPPTFHTNSKSVMNGYQPIQPLPTPIQRPRLLSTSSLIKKTSRDLLTDDEKRINHIASEQKRRNTIRTGFKDLTDIIPTLKNINNSKSTVLFKAADYIKHLDRRNKDLLEKLNCLQVRSRVQNNNNSIQKKARNSQRYKQVFGKHQQQELPAHTISALIAHKDQQRQLQELQDQLRVQQQLLTKHNIIPSSSSISLSSQYNSISIPSNSSSHSDENELFSLINTNNPNNHSKRPWHLL